MRLRISDRILVFLAGIVLIACCAGIVCQMFFGVDVVGLASRAFSSSAFQIRVALICVAVILLMLGCYCIFVLFRHRKRRDRFVLQKNENGELAISVKALENMVQKCLDQHPELKLQKIYLENRKDGLRIQIRGDVAGGISIPLTVEVLQKQIRQYVTACSGVEIGTIRVEIESSGREAANAQFVIAAPVAKTMLHEAEQKPISIPEPEETAEPAVSAPEPVPASASAEPAQTPVFPEDEEDDRPLHQRLFGPKTEACYVPEPPESSDSGEMPEEAVSELSDPDELTEEIVPTDSGQMFESGFPESETDQKPDGSESEAASESGHDPESEPESESATVSEYEPEAESEYDSKPEPESESVIGSEPESEPEDLSEKDPDREEDPDGTDPKDSGDSREKKTEADPEYLNFLKMFDDMVTGKNAEEKNDE